MKGCPGCEAGRWLVALRTIESDTGLSYYDFLGQGWDEVRGLVASGMYDEQWLWTAGRERAYYFVEHEDAIATMLILESYYADGKLIILPEFGPWPE